VEDVVMRLLAKGETMPIEEMGLTKNNFSELLKIITKPYGMILVVGPTGSGKTTTLHAALRHINKPDRKIWTAEDPVEITQYGLRQVQVQPKIGFDFAAAMRSFLRADPDIIMVGEMRDYETAKTGVEASLTGHLVFSTLHTNSAPETIVRLLDMGIDPLNFADALLGILAQRLVRTLCKKCKEQYHPEKEEYDEIAQSYGEEEFAKLKIPYNNSFKLYRPKGCDACDKTGYKGRMGIHELLVATDEIKRLVQKHETVEVLRNTAMSEGMTTLLQDGILKSIQGLTDFKQVRRSALNNHSFYSLYKTVFEKKLEDKAMNIGELLGAMVQTGMSPSSNSRMKNSLGGDNVMDSLSGMLGKSAGQEVGGASATCFQVPWAAVKAVVAAGSVTCFQECSEAAVRERELQVPAEVSAICFQV
jgi:type II secretory ATPase GspE/PulE/Tfp pilus assembly ATPase PilB-like protein